LRVLNRRLNAGATITRALTGRWITLSDLSEILRIPPETVYNQLSQLAKQNGSYVLLLQGGSGETKLLLLPTHEWKNLLRYVSLLPKAA